MRQHTGDDDEGLWPGISRASTWTSTRRAANQFRGSAKPAHRARTDARAGEPTDRQRQSDPGVRMESSRPATLSKGRVEHHGT